MGKHVLGRILGGGIFLVAGCVTHTVQQSTLFTTPVAGLPPTSHGRVDVALGGSGTTFIETESRPPTSEAGSWLTRGQLDGQIGVRMNRFLGVRALGFLGIAEGAVAPRPTDLERPGPVAGGGGVVFSAGYSRAGEPFFGRLEIGALVGFYPSVLLATAAGPCLCVSSRAEHTSFMPIVHGAITVGYWVLEELALSFGLVLRNQPRLMFPSSFGVVGDAQANISFGDPVAVPWVATEVEISHAVGLVAQVQLPVAPDVVLGPTISVGLRVVIGREPSPRAPRKPTVDESAERPTAGPLSVTSESIRERPSQVPRHAPPSADRSG